MTTISYGMTARLNISCGRAVEAATEALRREGFGILTTIDVRKTLGEETGADFGYYVILGACNPALAHALQSDVDAGVILPCNVSVRGEGQGCVVSILDPELMARISGREGVMEVAYLARAKLERVLAQLKGVTG